MDALNRLRNRMADKGINAVLISDIANVHWLTGFSGTSGFALVTPESGVFITDSRYSQQAPEQVKDLDVKIFSNPTSAAEAIAASAKSLGISELGFEAEHVTFATHESWKQKLNGTSLRPVSELADSLRLVKSADEIAKVKQACGLADSCFTHVLKYLQLGVAEYDISLEIEFFIRRNKAKLAFPPIVVSGERSARPHGEASEKKLEKGDFVTLDFGANVDGYNSDITRTVVIGEATNRHREIYHAVLEAQEAALAAIKPGVPAKEVDALSREILGKYDLAKYFGHGLGHGLGSTVHDVGRMSSQSTDVLEPGQIWTVEPGVYIEGFGGVRIEDDIVVTETGCDILTKSPKQLMVL